MLHFGSWVDQNPPVDHSSVEVEYDCARWEVSNENRTHYPRLATCGDSFRRSSRATNRAVCNFTVQGDSTRPAVTGPNDIVPLVHVVEQPDSPIEVVSVDLQGMWLSISNGKHDERDCANYRIRNRSDRPVQEFGIGLMVANASGGGGMEVQNRSPLAAGQSVEIQGCGGSGHGGAPGDHVRVLVYVHRVDFGGCLYRPSFRIPRSLNVNPLW
jgi:hypothetical protein